MEFLYETDYDKINLLDKLEFPNILNKLDSGLIEINNLTTNEKILVKVELSDKEVEVLKAGGKLNYTKRETATAK